MEKTTAKDMEDTMEEVTSESSDTSTDNGTTASETTELSGTWQGTMNGSDGTIVTLTLNSDGEYTLSLDEIQEAGKWSESDNNVVTLESGFLKREFVFDGTTLTNEDDKINLTKIDEK